MVLVDGNNLFVKCNHVFRFMESDGRNIGGMFGFIRNLWLMSKKLGDKNIFVVWDGKNSREKRKMIFPGYKEGRVGFDSSFFEIRDELKYVLENCIGVFQLVADSLEADDIIGHIASVVPDEDIVYIVSADKDFWQLVNDKVFIFTSNKVLKWENIQKVTGCKDGNEFLSCRALAGDPSDKIPGIPGIGLKKALKVIRSGSIPEEYKEIMERNLKLMCLSNQYIDNIDIVKGKVDMLKFMEWCRKYKFKSLVDMIGDFLEN